MNHFKKIGSTSTHSKQIGSTLEYDQSQLSRYTDDLNSSVYNTGRISKSSSTYTPYTNNITSDIPSSDQTRRASIPSSLHYNQPPKEHIRLMPVKVKDIINLFNNNPAYRDKSPVMINVKENDIDELIEQQRYKKNNKLSFSPEQSLRQSLWGSPISVRKPRKKKERRFLKQSSERDLSVSNTMTASPQKYLRKSFRDSPSQSTEDNSRFLNQSLKQKLSPKYLKKQFKEELISNPSINLSNQVPGLSRPLSADQAHPYPMTDIQAFPMIGTTGFRTKKSPFKEKLISNPSSNWSNQVPSLSRLPLGPGQAHPYTIPDIQAFPLIGTSGFKASKSYKRKELRSKSRRNKFSPARYVVKKPRKKKLSRLRKPSRSRRRSRSRIHSRPISKLRIRSKSRGRSKRRRSRPRKVVRLQSRRKSPAVIIKRRRYRPKEPFWCSPYPFCDNECIETTRTPPYPLRRNTIQSRVSITCNCNLCTEKLQFIQPETCSKKKYIWTNEYAIIPKPQVNLINPCTDLDPTIYPRANNPCIRDARGNPLTDCIGRPLRDPIGKKFLNFSANGSVIDTNFRGNFYTSQPPVCVKCTMPHSSYQPVPTHKGLMHCDHPVKPNMKNYFNHVVARENYNIR